MNAASARRALVVALLLTAAAGAPAAGAPDGGGTVPGEVVVGLVDGSTVASRAALERRTGVRLGAALTPRGRTRLARIAPGAAAGPALARLAADPAVRWAEPNRVFRAQVAPGDPGFPLQWGLLNTGQRVSGVSGTPGADIGAPAAWAVTTGSPSVRVAVVDGGIEAANPDLAPNVGVVNPGEAGGGRETNGVDDDGNGLVDDWRGWDFVDGDGDPADEDPIRHGTTVAGVIGARGGDATGIAGVSWASRIIPVRALDGAGDGTTADLAAAITYAAARGARILNASFGGPRSLLIEEAIAAAPQMLVVAAAGNGGGDARGDDNDGPASGRVYPCSLPLENVVCVAATGQSDQLADFSNHGATNVDVAAPGVSIVGPPRTPAGRPVALSGTSFAAPHAAGVAALVLAVEPGASTRRLRRALLEGAVPRSSLTGRVATGARLSAPGALAAIPPAEPGPGGASGPATELGDGRVRLTGTVPASSVPLAYHFEYGASPAYGHQTATRPLPPGGVRAVADDVADPPPGALHHRLVVLGLAGVTHGDDVVSRVPPAPPPPPPPPVVAPPPPPVVVPTARPAPGRPVATVRRSGRRWSLALALRGPSAVSVLVQRRRPAARGRAPAWRNARGLPRRGMAPGARRLPLGRLSHGRHRVVVRVTTAGRPVRLVRSFVVPRPRRA